jgi:hypothetical protein
VGESEKIKLVEGTALFSEKQDSLRLVSRIAHVKVKFCLKALKSNIESFQKVVLQTQKTGKERKKKNM